MELTLVWETTVVNVAGSDLLPPKPKPAWWQRPRIVLPIVVVVAAAVVIGIKLPGWLASCAPGVTRIDGECIGVTAGDYVFNPEFADVEGKIAAANEAAVAGGHAVTIALLEPFTVTDTTALNPTEVRHELEGAYTAQWRANNTRAIGDTRPMIRLVLANEGGAERQWQAVTRQLEGMTHDSAPLVAVAGLGVSFPETVAGAQELSTHGLPTVGGIITADQIDYAHIHGFVRVDASDREFVIGLRQYLARHPELNSTLVVYDDNSDNGTDLYTASLRGDLEDLIVPTMRHFDAKSFHGSSVPSEANTDMFSNITTSICAVGPNLVLYAGRLVDLEVFLTSLESRLCRDQPITVATAGTDLGQLNNPTTVAQLRAGNVSVVYATPTDAAGWAADSPGTPPHFADFYTAFTGRGFDPPDLTDGDAIVTHDAVLTAIKATRLAYASEPGADPALPNPADVLSQLLNLNNRSDVVPAGAGDLSFSYQGLDTGNPEDKPIPVLRIPADGSSAEPVYSTP